MRKPVRAISNQQRRSTFVVRCLDSITSIAITPKISRPYLASVAEQAGLSLTLPPTPKIGFFVTWLKKLAAKTPSFWLEIDMTTYSVN